MKTKDYWLERLADQEKLYDKLAASADRRLASLYSRTAKNIAGDIAVLMTKIKSDKVIMNDLYKNNQYYILLSQINEELRQLGEEEIKITDAALLQCYAETSRIVSNQLAFSIGNDAARQVVDKIWCLDGKHFSSRIWDNKAAMEDLLEKGLVDAVSRGLPKDKIVKEIQTMANCQRYQADRIVRTELTYVQNQATADAYEADGIEKYRFLAAMDDRTSDICRSLNGKVFEVKNRQVGVNYPPCHPYCRSTTIPVVE